MAKLNSETLAGVGFTAALGDEPAAGHVLSRMVDTARGGQEQPSGEHHSETHDPDHSRASAVIQTRPGVGVNARPSAFGAAAAQRSGTHVRVSTQNGASVRPSAPAEVSEPPDRLAEPDPAPVPPSELAHDTLRGVGSGSTTDYSQSLPFKTSPKRREGSTGAPVDIDVYTSAPGVTLPIGTRLPKAFADAAQTPRLRGFATNPPITPKVLTRHLEGPFAHTNASAEESESIGGAPSARGNPAPIVDSAPRFDRTLAFGTTAKPGGAFDLGTTQVPITPRAKRPLTASSPEADASTANSGRPHPAPVPNVRPREETFRPSAHTTPPGVTDLQRKFPGYVWALAALPVACALVLATVTLEGTRSAQGAVVLDGGTTPVLTKLSGPIIQVLVKPGDVVAAGQAVAEIDPSTIERRRADLDAQHAALLAEQERVNTLGEKWHNAATEALQRKRGLLWQRLKLRSADGAPSASKSGDAEKSRAEHDAALLIRQELADVEFELNRRESDRDEQHRTWQHRMNEVRLALSQIHDTSTSVRAPVAGRVEVLLAEPGQVLAAGSPVAHLVPASAATRIVVLVPTRSAALLDVGTEVTVALLGQGDAVAPARVTHIADGNVTREEAATLLNEPHVEPLVRVEVEFVDPASIPNLDAVSRPGQRVSALVPDEKRSLWRHLVEKFR